MPEIALGIVYRLIEQILVNHDRSRAEQHRQPGEPRGEARTS